MVSRKCIHLLVVIPGRDCNSARVVFSEAVSQTSEVLNLISPRRVFNSELVVVPFKRLTAPLMVSLASCAEVASRKCKSKLTVTSSIPMLSDKPRTSILDKDWVDAAELPGILFSRVF